MNFVIFVSFVRFVSSWPVVLGPTERRPREEPVNPWNPWIAEPA